MLFVCILNDVEMFFVWFNDVEWDEILYSKSHIHISWLKVCFALLSFALLIMMSTNRWWIKFKSFIMMMIWSLNVLNTSFNICLLHAVCLFDICSMRFRCSRFSFPKRFLWFSFRFQFNHWYSQFNILD